MVRLHDPRAAAQRQSSRLAARAAERRFLQSARVPIGRRSAKAFGHCDGHHAVHQRFDHHAADDRGDAAARGDGEERRRGRPKENQPVHALADDRARLDSSDLYGDLHGTLGRLLRHQRLVSALRDNRDGRRNALSHVARRADQRQRHRQRRLAHHLHRHRPSLSTVRSQTYASASQGAESLLNLFSISRLRSSSSSRSSFFIKDSAEFRCNRRVASSAAKCLPAARPTFRCASTTPASSRSSLRFRFCCCRSRRSRGSAAAKPHRHGSLGRGTARARGLFNVAERLVHAQRRALQPRLLLARGRLYVLLQLDRAQHARRGRQSQEDRAPSFRAYGRVSRRSITSTRF